MLEGMNLIIGVGVLILGFFIGKFIAYLTKEELDSGQIYFRVLVLVGLVGGLLGLILRNDVLMFTLFFISIVTLGSLKTKKGNIRDKESFDPSKKFSS